MGFLVNKKQKIAALIGARYFFSIKKIIYSENIIEICYFIIREINVFLKGINDIALDISFKK